VAEVIGTASAVPTNPDEHGQNARFKQI